MVSGELVKRISNGDGFWPYIWLVEISNTAGTLDPAAAVTQTPSFNLFFLDSNDYENWSIQQHYDNDIYVMSNYIDFILGILKSRRDVYETDSITYTTTNHVNFGDYIVDEGMNERILNDNVTGVQLQIDLPIIIQSCSDVTITANCPIIIETFNGDPIVSPISFKNIVVQTNDAIPVQTGTKLIDTSESLVIEVNAGGACDDAENQVNGDAKVSIPSGGSKNFIIRYEDDSPVVVTEISDSATEFIGEVPNSVTGISYQRSNWTARNTEYNTHDLGWYLANESGNFDYNVVGQSPTLDITDKTKLTSLNAFGNFDRVTNSLGLTATYDGSNGEIADYAIDHLTGLGWYLQNAVATNIDFVDSATTLRAATLATFSDWRMLTFQDVENVVIDNITGVPNTIFTGIESWTTDLTWVMNSAGTNTGYFWRLNQHIGSSLWMNTRSITSPNVSIMTIGTRNHY